MHRLRDITDLNELSHRLNVDIRGWSKASPLFVAEAVRVEASAVLRLV